MARKKPDIGPLVEAMVRHDATLKDVAGELYIFVEVLALERGNGHGVPLIDLINAVYEQLGELGLERDPNTLIGWYRTAAWVADHNNGDVKWLEDRYFTHHLRAMRRPTWTWAMLIEAAPPKKINGTDSSGEGWRKKWRRAYTELDYSRDLIGVDERRVRGSRGKMIIEIGNETDKALKVLAEAAKIIDRL
jgi:hypothetical protein